MNNPVFVDGYPLPDVGAADGQWTVDGRGFHYDGNNVDACLERSAQWIALARAIDAETRAAEQVADDYVYRLRRSALAKKIRDAYVAGQPLDLHLSPADVIAVNDMLNKPT